MRHVLIAATSLSLLIAPTATAAQQAGQLIAADPVADTPGGMQAWRVRYWSLDAANRPQQLTGIVVTPREVIPREPRRVIAWTHGTSGVASRCAPSLSPSFWTATPALAAVASGNVVVAPDYPGLGSDGVHSYLVGVPTARSTLDAVRAARQIAGAAAGGSFAVWGESQGGHAALWTGPEARRYAPELQLVGVAAAAPPTDLIANLRSGKDPSVRAFLTAFTAHSWSRYYRAPLASLGNRQTQGIITRLAENNCISLDTKPKLGTMHGVLVLRRDLKNADLGTIQPWARHSRINSASAAAITTPLLIAQNGADMNVNPAVTRRFGRQACALNKRVRWIDIAGKGHETSAKDSTPTTLTWIADRFARRPVPNDCRRI
ncbi:MAG: lipase family protein [Sphingomonas bacterium]|nr:lipase family protein [Sphingomonas bacterium]